MSKKLLIAAACLAMAACGGSGAGDTSTTTPDTTPITAAPDSITTPTTLAETSTTTSSTTPSTTSTTSSGASGDLGLIHSAMAKSAESAPSRIEGVMSMSGLDTGTGDPVDLEIPFSVLTDAATGNTAMTMDMGAMAAAMGGGEGLPAEMAEMMGSMEVRQIDDLVYLKFPFMTAFLGADTEWVSMPAEEGTDVTGGFGPGANPTDPSSFLDSLSDADGTAENLGSEEIRGIGTTHYQVIVDDSWRDELTPEELADLEAQGPLPTASFPLDLWVDDDGLVQRMAMNVAGSEATVNENEQGFESMTMTFDFFDFGQSVVIEAPPADQVTDASELSGGFGTLEP